MSEKRTKRERMDDANQVLFAISRYGRRFFYCQKFDRVSQFELDYNNRIWLRDNWTGKRVCVSYRGRWRHFTEGGTLRSLCEALLKYIRTGEPISRKWFGPWPDWICDGDLWGYGAEEWAKLRAELPSLRAVAPTL